MVCPQAPVLSAFQLTGAQLGSPIWLPEAQAVAVLDGDGHQWLLKNEYASALSSDIQSHAYLDCADSGYLITGEGSEATLRCVTVTSEGVGRAAQIPLCGSSLSSVSMLLPSSNGGLLVALQSGCLINLSRDSEPVSLYSNTFTAHAGCLSSDERTLHLCRSDGVYECTVNLEIGECSDLKKMHLDLPSAFVPNAIATDTTGNLYVCGDDGVTICTASGEMLARMSTPAPVTGCCFGGASFSEFFFTTGDTLWRVKANVQGVQPSSTQFLQRMDKLTAAGEFRHEGW